MYGDITQDLLNSIDSIQKEEVKNSKKDEKLEKLLNTFHDTVTTKLLQTAKDAYGADLSKSAQKTLTQKLTKNTEKVVKKQYGEYQIKCKTLENEREKEIKIAEELGDRQAIAEIQQNFDMQKDRLEKDFYNNLNASVPSIIEASAKSIVQTTEAERNEKKKNSILDGIKDHLRGFSRTIPSFIMAYGDENITLENFDTIIPDFVFKEVTSISLEEFRVLRDGFSYIDDDGPEKNYNGFFDSVVFNDSIQEFLKVKKRLANYFEEDMIEDIFDYIPPQKTNQIYTPKIEKHNFRLCDATPYVQDGTLEAKLDELFKE